MHNGHGYTPSRSRTQSTSSRRNMRDVAGPVVPSTPSPRRWDPGTGSPQYVPPPKPPRDGDRGGGGGWTPGAGGIPNWATKFNINKPKGPSAWERFWSGHRPNTQIMKGKVRGLRIPGTDESGAPTYTHALGGYDWKQNFPNTPELLDKALAYGYQHLTEGTRALTDPTSYGTGIFGLAKNLGSAFNKANVEAGKNIQGFTGEGISPEAMQKYQTWQNLFARGGIVDLYRHGGF